MQSRESAAISYLSGSTEFDQLKSFSSRSSPLTSGVPQGCPRIPTLHHIPWQYFSKSVLSKRDSISLSIDNSKVSLSFTSHINNITLCAYFHRRNINRLCPLPQILLFYPPHCSLCSPQHNGEQSFIPICFQSLELSPTRHP